MCFKFLTSFIAWLKRLYFKQNAQPILKLSHTIYSEKLGYDICVVQIVGKNSFAKLEAQYLVTHSNILRAFSHEDVVSITKIADSIQNTFSQKTYKIREIHRDDGLQKNIVVIEQANGTQELRTVTLHEIEHNKSLLNKLKPDEAFLLGHTKAMQDITEEQEAINKIKKEIHKNKLIQFKKYWHQQK